MKQTLKKISKAFFKSRPVRNALCWTIASIIRLTCLLSRVTFHVDEAALPFFRGERKAIYVSWHGRNVLAYRLRPKNRRIFAMVSLHRDGEWLAQTLLYLGLDQVRGSSRKGGFSATRDAIEVLSQEHSLGMTPDGPRGPRHIAKMGPIVIARLTQTEIIPCSFSTNRAHVFKSWDRYLWPLPFGHIHFCIGAPILPHQDEAQDERMRQQMEAAINTQTHHADMLAGRADF